MTSFAASTTNFPTLLEMLVASSNAHFAYLQAQELAKQVTRQKRSQELLSRVPAEPVVTAALAEWLAGASNACLAAHRAQSQAGRQHEEALQRLLKGWAGGIARVPGGVRATLQGVRQAHSVVVSAVTCEGVTEEGVPRNARVSCVRDGDAGSSSLALLIQDGALWVNDDNEADWFCYG